jgi:predicted RNase H-like nuclease/ppGpp synthetase/RelA/SpoT-type nucleotidyltranferase
MHFVGVDLAWGDRRPTGLAVLDDEGRLVHVSAVRSDDEIAEALAPYVEGDCLVAIDAPLIVTNATGNRPAEAALNKDFARFDAGAHPSNTGKPEFAVQPRGARIAARLGLDMNPRSGRARRAIEVYPHPATVALFRLGRTLKYKNKPGRDLDQLRSELVVLIGLLEGLATADPPLHVDGTPAGPTRGRAWRRLRSAAEQAGRKSELRVVEDQVDAVVCAYVGLHAERRPELTTTYGDVETGYIVTPTLPADLVPSPRGPRISTRAQDPAAAVRRYAELHPQLRQVADQWVALVTSVLDEAGINYLSVNGRAKSVSSFAAKAARTLPDGTPAYADPLTEITDQIGVRVITYVHSDVQAVADLLADEVVVLDDRDFGEETAGEGRFGYASRHLLVGLDPQGPVDDELALLRGRPASIQIRTVLQHAWAEFEHDIRYKGQVPDEHVSDLDRRFTLAAGLLELADREFSTIRDRLRVGVPDLAADAPSDDDPRISPRELAAFLAGQYPDAGWSRTDHYAWMAGLILELGITSLAELAESLRGVDDETVRERMDYRYPPGAVRRLDDALLWVHGDAYVALRGNAHRVGALQARLAKMRATG